MRFREYVMDFLRHFLLVFRVYDERPMVIGKKILKLRDSHQM